MSLIAPDNPDDRPVQSNDSKADEKGTNPVPESVNPGSLDEPNGIAPDPDIVAAIGANAARIREKADNDDIERLQNRIDDLADQVVDVHEENKTLHNRVSDLERSQRTAENFVNSNLGKLNRLLAAVFEEESRCSECNDGKLTIRDNWWNKKIVCSNKRCEFEQNLAEP